MNGPETALDSAVLAYRANPCEDTRTELDRAGRDHVDTFYREQATDYAARTRGQK